MTRYLINSSQRFEDELRDKERRARAQAQEAHDRALRAVQAEAEERLLREKRAAEEEADTVRGCERRPLDGLTTLGVLARQCAG